MSVDISEGRRLLEAAHVYIADDGRGRLAIWNRSTDPPFIVRRLIVGWGLDELAAWTINNLGALLDGFDELVAEVAKLRDEQ